MRNLAGVGAVRGQTETARGSSIASFATYVGSVRASKHHATAAEERVPSCKARPRRLRLSDKLFSGLFGSLLEVLARLDNDRRISILNLNVVHLPKSAPDAPIDDFWKFCFHDLLVS